LEDLGVDDIRNIKTGTKEIAWEGVDSIYLTPYMDQCLVAVKMVKNARVIYLNEPPKNDYASLR
jgi:hypothetical protein